VRTEEREGKLLNGWDVLPALDFILGPPVSVVRREEDSYAGGTGGQKDGNMFGTRWTASARSRRRRIRPNCTEKVNQTG
jgi:hypothetical protein